jgi:hypothetical protein
LKVNDCLGDQGTDGRTTLKHVRFEILTEMNIKITFFWDVTQCSLAEIYKPLSSRRRWRKPVL